MLHFFPVIFRAFPWWIIFCLYYIGSIVKNLKSVSCLNCHIEFFIFNQLVFFDIEDKCTNAEVVVQKSEYEFMLNPHPVDHRYYPDVLDDVKVNQVQGDTTILDGIDLIYSPGHSVGGQSVAVNTSQGKAIITGFCCNDRNFPSTGPAIAPGVHIDLTEAYDSIQKIKQMADILLPLHDPAVGRQKCIP